MLFIAYIIMMVKVRSTIIYFDIVSPLLFISDMNFIHAFGVLRAYNRSSAGYLRLFTVGGYRRL